MKILCITDQFEGSDHSSIEGIFGRYLRELCGSLYGIFYRGTRLPADVRVTNIYIPYRYKRYGMTEVLAQVPSHGGY